MKAQILEFWDRLRTSFWFVPALMAAASVALALGAVSIDEAVTLEWLQARGWAYTGGAEGASLVLSTIAGSMITIAGVVFSMTLVALSLASSQLGPRLPVPEAEDRQAVEERYQMARRALTHTDDLHH